MLELSVSGAPPRGFLRIGASAPYSRAETTYLKRYALSPLNAYIANGNSACIRVLRDGKPIMRLIAFSGAQNNARTGFFSLFDGENDAQAARLILGALEKKQREWGSRAIIGPVSPDESVFFHGLATRLSDPNLGVMSAKNQPHIESFLTRADYLQTDEQLAFLARVPDKNPLSALSARAGARFGVSVRKLNVLGLGAGDEAAVHALMEEAEPRGLSYNELLKRLERIKPIISRAHSYLALVDGVPKGFVLTLAGARGRLRVTTLMTARDSFSPPVTLSIISALVDSLIKARVSCVEASSISAQNAPSLGCVRRFSATVLAKYRCYTKILEN